MVRSLGFWPADAGDDLRIETLYSDLTSIYSKIMTMSQVICLFATWSKFFDVRSFFYSKQIFYENLLFSFE